MSLTPEERRRIYEEEKARIEAQAKIKAEQGSSTADSCFKGCAFCAVGFVALLILISALTPSTHSEDTVGDWDARQMAHEFVKDRLKSPSTAEFPDEYSGQETVEDLPNKTYKVSGWVDAQNGFGAKLRSIWTVKLHYEGAKQWKADYVNLDE